MIIQVSDLWICEFSSNARKYCINSSKISGGVVFCPVTLCVCYVMRLGRRKKLASTLYIYITTYVGLNLNSMKN